MSETNEASPVERVVMCRWQKTANFPFNDFQHRRLLASAKNMPDCVGSYEDGYFTLGDCFDPGNIFEGDKYWFMENFSLWADFPKCT